MWVRARQGEKEREVKKMEKLYLTHRWPLYDTYMYLLGSEKERQKEKEKDLLDS